MELRPLVRTDSQPSYPARPAGRLGLGGRLERLAAAAGLALALGAGGCMGINPLEPEEEEWELGGAERMPRYFVCSDAAPTSPWSDTMYPSGYHEGTLCGDQTAWGRLEVTEAVTVTGALTASDGGATAAFISPEGIEAFELRSDLPEMTFALPPGTWTIAVDAMTPDAHGWFSLQLTQVSP